MCVLLLFSRLTPHATTESSLRFRPLCRPLAYLFYLRRCSRLDQINRFLKQNFLTETNLDSHAVPVRQVRFAQQGFILIPRRRVPRHLVRERLGNDPVECLAALSLVCKLGFDFLQSLE